MSYVASQPPNTQQQSSTTPPTSKRTPTDFLQTVLGRPVHIKLNNGIQYYGVLACLDGFMNVALEQCEERIGGVSKKKYGDAFIRGNNIMYIEAVGKRR